MVIYDMTGRKVLDSIFTDPMNQRTFDLGSLANATYVLRLEGAHGITIKQLIKK